MTRRGVRAGTGTTRGSRRVTRMRAGLVGGLVVALGLGATALPVAAQPGDFNPGYADCGLASSTVAQRPAVGHRDPARRQGRRGRWRRHGTGCLPVQDQRRDRHGIPVKTSARRSASAPRPSSARTCSCSPTARSSCSSPRPTRRPAAVARPADRAPERRRHARHHLRRRPGAHRRVREDDRPWTESGELHRAAHRAPGPVRASSSCCCRRPMARRSSCAWRPTAPRSTRRSFLPLPSPRQPSRGPSAPTAPRSFSPARTRGSTPADVLVAAAHGGRRARHRVPGHRQLRRPRRRLVREPGRRRGPARPQHRRRWHDRHRRDLARAAPVRVRPARRRAARRTWRSTTPPGSSRSRSPVRRLSSR